MIAELEAALGVKFFDHQRKVFDSVVVGESFRFCLYHRTGAGKSITSLVAIKLAGYDEAVVIAPPSTHEAWAAQAARLGMQLECMSHAKYRMKDTKLSRHKPLVVDEFHLLGGHRGKGWVKMDTMARHLQAPMVIASATPNYNDAERVYCIQHVLDPLSCRGGYIEFLYQHCETEQNAFGKEPIVTGFRNYRDAEHYLSSLPNVFHLPDKVVYTIEEVELSTPVIPELDKFGYDRFRHRVIASGMEEKHRRIQIALIDPNGYLSDEAYDLVMDIVRNAATPVLVYANHATVAVAMGMNLTAERVSHAVITGDTTPKNKETMLGCFRRGELPVLVGTASLATGTDGMDKVCNTLVILDDTDDDSLRRQLIGRIMPRGTDTDATMKRVYRVNLS